MKKMKKKKLLAISILFLFAINILAVVNLGPERVSAYDSPAVYIDPASGGVPPGSTYTIEIMTDYAGDDITAYQFSLTWNPSILEGVSVVNDGILDVLYLVDFVLGTFDNTAGSLSATYAYYIPAGYVTSGPGKLATVTFNVVGTGDSDIILGSDTYLLGWDAVNAVTYKIVNGVTMPFHLGHGYFQNLAVTHDVAVTAVTPSASDVVRGELVTIDVDVANEGTASETFDVTVWTGGLALSTQTVTNLAPLATTTLTFNWDTSGTAVATYIISAMAEIVAGETDTADNSLTDGTVNVKYAIAAIILAPDSVLLGTPVHFDGKESYAMGANIVSYFWDTGDPHTGQPNTYETAEFDHTYKWPGVYGVTLIVTDDQNRTSIPDYHTIVVYEPRDAKFSGYQARPEKHKWVASADDDGLVKVTAIAKNLANETMVLGVRVAIQDKYGSPVGPVYGEDTIVLLGGTETFELFVDPLAHGWDGEEKMVMYGQVTLWIDTTLDGTPNKVVDTKNIRFSVQP